MGAIAERVAAARAGTYPLAITRLASGWAVLGDPQVLSGYCLLYPDPVVPSLNDLDPAARATFLADMARLGDALLAVTTARRINYEILGNQEPELHAHVIPRFADEAEELRTRPIWYHDWEAAPRFEARRDAALIEGIRRELLNAR